VENSFDALFRTDYMPHGHCYWWTPEILWLNVISDVFIAIAYFSIPIAIYYFVKKRPGLEFKGIFILFSLFILCCGVTHLISIVVIWHGTYGIHGLVKLLTALISCITAYVVYKSIPQFLLIPSRRELLEAYEEVNNEKLARLHLENQKNQDLLLRESTENAHIGIFVVDESGRILVANSAVCQIFEYQKAELEGQNISVIISPDLMAKHPTLIEQFFKSPEINKNMASGRRVYGLSKLGKKIPVEIVLRHRVQTEGPVVYVSITDISQQIAAQEALEKSEMTTRNIIDCLPVGLHIFEFKNGEFFFSGFNPASDKILGIDNSALVGKSLKEAFPDIASSDIEEKYREVLKTGKTRVNDVVTYSDAQVVGTFLIHSFQSSPTTVITLFQDVTLQKKAEQEVIEKEQFIRRVFDSSLTGVYIFNLQNYVTTFINESYTRITGLTINDLNNMTERQFIKNVHPSDRQHFIDFIERISSGSEIENSIALEYRFKHKLGHWIWCLGQNTVFEQNEEGIPTLVMGSFLDISPMKYMQQNLIDLKNTAEQANAIKSQFLANMSHEIRTPMNAILGLTQLVLDMELGLKQRQYLSKVVASSKSLLSILNDILDYSKMEAGKLIIVEEAFELTEIVENVSGLFGLLAEEKHISLVVTMPSTLPRYLTGDQLRITQILNNIVGNAVKFTEKGRVEIAIWQEPILSSKEHSKLIPLVFEVTDTGIGMSQDQVKSLFSSFTQADSSISRNYGGTGLGMSISQGLAKAMGGEIKIKSHLGQGSVFTFSISLVEADVQLPSLPIVDTTLSNLKSEQAQREAQLQFSIKSNKPLSSNNILLVEDNVTNQLVAVEILSGLGAEVYVASNGKQAVEMFPRQHFDLVLMDLQMPIMDGFAATQAIRLLDKTTPILAMSAAVMKADIARVAAAGMNDHIAKPIDIANLKLVLSKWLIKNTVSSTVTEQNSEDNSVDLAFEPLIQSAIDALQQRGFDTRSSLNLLANDKRLYIKFLKSFYFDHQQTPNRLRQHVEQNDKTQIALLVHTIKGLAATAGASQLVEMAKHIEQDSTKQEGQLKDFIQLLSQVLAEIKQQVAELETVESKVSFSNTDLAEFTPANLRKLLSFGKILSHEQLQGFKLVLSQKLSQASCLDLFNAIAQLDYNTALILLKEVEN
jgi:PAS domain S-box-containing protein